MSVLMAFSLLIDAVLRPAMMPMSVLKLLSFRRHCTEHRQLINIHEEERERAYLGELDELLGNLLSVLRFLLEENHVGDPEGDAVRSIDHRSHVGSSVGKLRAVPRLIEKLRWLPGQCRC